MTDGLKWAQVAAFDDLEEGFPEAVGLDGRRIALFRIGGTVYATDDQCPHEEACLSDGYVEGNVVECPLHQSRFHIPTGEVFTPPATEDLTVYPVKVEDGAVLVGLKRD
jgi:NAD(P)H-dependent nitrite reductase small subunit